MADTQNSIIIEGLRKRYGGDTAVDALKSKPAGGAGRSRRPDQTIQLGQSTLLKCLGAVIEPSAGRT